MKLSDELRRCIKRSDKTVNHIAEKTAIRPASLYAFVKDKADIRISTAERLMKFFSVKVAEE